MCTPLVLADMQDNGFDPAHPIIVRMETDEIIGGHTRYKAACELGLNQIYVAMHSFDTEEAALAYAIADQVNRRNLSDADILRLVERLDQVKDRGRGSQKPIGKIKSAELRH